MNEKENEISHLSPRKKCKGKENIHPAWHGTARLESLGAAPGSSPARSTDSSVLPVVSGESSTRHDAAPHSEPHRPHPATHPSVRPWSDRRPASSGPRSLEGKGVGVGSWC